MQDHQTLVILDDVDSLQVVPGSSSGDVLLGLLKHPNTSVIVLSSSCDRPVKLQQDIDHCLLRGSTIHEIFPLPQILAMQRFVYELEKHQVHIAQKDQPKLEDCVEHACGSPDILSLTAAVLLHTSKHCGELSKPVDFSANLEFKNLKCSEPHIPGKDAAITKLLECCNLNSLELLVLYCLSGLSTAPIPQCVVMNLINMCMIEGCGYQTSQKSLLDILETLSLVHHYPQPVIKHTALREEADVDLLYYIPQTTSAALWDHHMSDEDKMVSLSLMYKAVNESYIHCSRPAMDKTAMLHIIPSILGLHQAYETYFELMGTECYTEVCSLLCQAQSKKSSLDKLERH